MKRIKIEGSSFALSVGFEQLKGEPTGVLEVEKVNGQLLRFSNVTMPEYVELARAESFGKAIQPFLRGKNGDGTAKYPCMTVPSTMTKEQREKELSKEAEVER